MIFSSASSPRVRGTATTRRDRGHDRRRREQPGSDPPAEVGGSEPEIRGPEPGGPGEPDEGGRGRDVGREPGPAADVPVRDDVVERDRLRAPSARSR